MAATSSPTEPPKPAWRPGTFRALRHRNYRLYFIGQTVSLTGSWVQTTALTWLAYELTDSTHWAALVGIGSVLPTLLLAVPAGALADRWPRRPLIFLAQSALLALSLALAGLILAGAATPAALLAVSLLVGVVNAIDTPARLAFVIDMVGREDLANAVALNSLVFNSARLAGPALAGLILPRLGPGGCVLLNAATFAAVLAALCLMRLPPRAPADARRRGSLADGFAHVVRDPRLCLVAVMGASLAFFGWPLLSLLTGYSDRALGAGAGGFSMLTAAIGGGALVGALVVASCADRGRLLLLAVGVVVGALALVGLAATSSLAMAVVWCAASGAGLILFFASGQAAMQLGAGEHNRGRVLGVWLMVLSGAQPAGNFLFGYLADVWDVRSVLLVDAAGIAATAAVVSALALWLSPRSPAG